MQEIARSFEADGLPDGFHRAAARIYEKLARASADGGGEPPALEDLAKALRAPSD